MAIDSYSVCPKHDCLLAALNLCARCLVCCRGSAPLRSSQDDPEQLQLCNARGNQAATQQMLVRLLCSWFSGQAQRDVYSQLCRLWALRCFLASTFCPREMMLN